MCQDKFLSTEMTPRAWRTIFYCCVGFLIYGGIVLAELLQDVKLARFKQQLKMAERLGQKDLLQLEEEQKVSLKQKEERNFFNP